MSNLDAISLTQFNDLMKRVSELEREMSIVKSEYLSDARKVSGNTRELTLRYREMINNFKTIKDLKKESPDFIAGYEHALKTFEKRKL